MVPDDNGYVRLLVAQGWTPGGGGKGLLLDDAGDRLLCWRTLAFGGPHHADAIQALGIEPERVAAYLSTGADGQLTVIGGSDADEQALTRRACALD